MSLTTAAIPLSSTSDYHLNLSHRVSSQNVLVIHTKTIPGKNDTYGYGEGNTYQFKSADLFDHNGTKLNNNPITKQIIDIGDDWALGIENTESEIVHYAVWKIPSYDLDTDPIARFSLPSSFVYKSAEGVIGDTVAFYRQTRDSNQKRITEIRIANVRDGSVQEFVITGETGECYQYYHPYLLFMFKDQSFGCSGIKIFDVVANKLARSGESQGGTFYNDAKTNGQVFVYRTNNSCKFVVEDLAGKKLGQILSDSSCWTLHNNQLVNYSSVPKFKLSFFSLADFKEAKSVTLSEREADLNVKPFHDKYILAGRKEISLVPAEQISK